MLQADNQRERANAFNSGNYDIDRNAVRSFASVYNMNIDCSNPEREWEYDASGEPC